MPSAKGKFEMVTHYDCEVMRSRRKGPHACLVVACLSIFLSGMYGVAFQLFVGGGSVQATTADESSRAQKKSLAEKVAEATLAEMRTVAEKSTSVEELVHTGREAVDIAIAARKRHNEKVAERLSEV